MAGPEKHAMIPLEDALRIVLGCARPLGAERVALDSAPGRVLAEDVRSDVDMPPFNKSAMDGYACRRADLGRELAVVETIMAGDVPQRPVGAKQCAKVMTGAPVPPGADCVVMVEFSEETAPGRVRFVGKGTADNICLRGEDVVAGDIVLRRGTLIRPRHVAMLASVGCVVPAVARRPTVGVIATGDELVPPGEKPEGGCIRDSNGYQLCAQVSDAGAVPRYYGIAADTEEAIGAALQRAVGESDVVLMSGGVSAGELDLVPDVLEKNGFELLIEQIAIKPGRPTTFAVQTHPSPSPLPSGEGRGEGCRCCFGLPGNPVSTFVVFELLVRPFLLTMMGHDYRPACALAPLGAAVRRKKAERQEWMPVVLTDEGAVQPVEFHGSAHSLALCAADGLIAMPVGVAELAQGSVVRVRLI
jgi:molybdopterin molybdotransferase